MKPVLSGFLLFCLDGGAIASDQTGRKILKDAGAPTHVGSPANKTSTVSLAVSQPAPTTTIPQTEGGGGGAPSGCFCAALLLLVAVRGRVNQQLRR